MKNIIALIVLVLITRYAYSEEQKLAFNYNKITIEQSVKLINDKVKEIESVAPNNDGTRLCWIGRSKFDKFIPMTVYTTKLNKTGEWEKAKTLKKRMKNMNPYSKCSFDAKDNLVISELGMRLLSFPKTIRNKKKTGIFEPKGFVGLISWYKKDTSRRIKRIKAKKLGQKSKYEFLKHPRVSPDGKWMVFYTMGEYGPKGVFMYNFETKKTTQISKFYDKHPTFTNDGKRILFHHQTKNEAGQEIARLGYLKLNIKGNKVSAVRVMLDDPNKEGYVYHKHPAQYGSTDLLFFHAQTKVDGKKKLMVRRMVPNSGIYDLKLNVDGVKLRKAKHPSNALNDTGLFFIGKPGESKRYNVYQLSPEAIKVLDHQI